MTPIGADLSSETVAVLGELEELYSVLANEPRFSEGNTVKMKGEIIITFGSPTTEEEESRLRSIREAARELRWLKRASMLLLVADIFLVDVKVHVRRCTD